MNAMQFNLNRTDVNTKLQDYIEMEIESENGQIKKPKNIIITSPTQVGKTSYIIENCKKNKNQPYLFVLTCDNSKAQMKQLETRLRDEGLVSFDLKTATSSRIENTLSQQRAVFILMLNNEKQITKLESVINRLQVNYKPKQYIIFHDEADTVNKADNGALDAPLSHKKWNSLFATISARNEIVKRFWVSATPENCSSIGNITGKDIVVLPVPENYVKVSENISWDGCSDEKLGYEITRVKISRTREVILYCVDKKKEEQSEMARKISGKFNCTSVCYNGDGSLVYRYGRLIEKVTSDISSIIDRFVPNVVVGYILMNRGISFVAGPVGRTLPPTATVMFYSGGSTTHIVGIAQKFGRICGTSRPDIQRRVVYCGDSVSKKPRTNIQEIIRCWNGNDNG
jgi:competence protein ComGF